MNWKIILLICVISFIAFVAGRFFAANIISSRLIQHLYMHETEKFISLRKTKLARLFLHQFNLRYIDLSKAMLEVDSKEVKKCIENLEALKLNIKQKEEIYSRCFYYYLSVEDMKNAKKYYLLVHDLDPDRYNEDMDRLYDVYILKDNKYLEDTLKEYKEADEDKKANLAVILSKIYENMNDTANSEKYTDIAEDYINKMKEKISNE